MAQASVGGEFNTGAELICNQLIKEKNQPRISQTPEDKMSTLCSSASSVVRILFLSAAPIPESFLTPLRQPTRSPRRPGRLHIFLQFSQIHFNQSMKLAQLFRELR